MKKLFIIFLFSFNLYAFDILIGAGAGTNTLVIHDRQEDDNVATMRDDFDFSPHISFRFSSDHQVGWGYLFELDFNVFEMDEQLISGSERDIGTKMNGLSTFIVPTIYYEFYKSSFFDLSYRLGGGVGLGLLFVTGNFEVTDAGNSRYGQRLNKSVVGFGYTYGVFFEALNNDHSIVVQSYGPSIEDERYRYVHQNTEILYRYIISF